LDGLGQTGGRLHTLVTVRQVSRNDGAEDEDTTTGGE
jgi:hypothetical protein